MEQNYLMINPSNVVDNVVTWDGNPDTWQPPSDYLMLVQATTPALVWVAIKVDDKITDYVLEEGVGQGGIGFTWDGTVLTTNQQKPQPVTSTSGTQNL